MTFTFKNNDVKYHILNEYNQYITKDFIEKLLLSYNCVHTIKNLSLYQTAMIHISYLEKTSYTDKTLKIIHNEKYDFLKLSFSEFYGENSVQWAWYNIPQSVREQYFPNKKHLPHTGTDPDAPKTKYTCIKQQDDLTYIEGDTHYCNWPIWMSREGNRKIFLNVNWDHPFEQTWMSYVFQKQQENLIKSSVLLLSPINHDRFEFYPGEDRREN